MKTRQVKKILGRQFSKVSPYWWPRILDYLGGRRRDHRMVKAWKIKIRKKTQRARLSLSGDSGKG